MLYVAELTYKTNSYYSEEHVRRHIIEAKNEVDATVIIKDELDSLYESNNLLGILKRTSLYKVDENSCLTHKKD